MTELEQTAMLIVLETPVSSKYSSTSYVRRELIADLERILRKAGWDIDKGRQHMRDIARKEKAESDARIAEFNARQQQDKRP